MKKILIVKCGNTFDFIKEKYGDFEDFIIRQAAIDKENFVVIDAQKEKYFPKEESISGIILTGSHSMVTDEEDWSLILSKWILDISKKDIPILGICYGHQLLCKAFGGIVGYNPKGIEKGTVSIKLTENGQEDSLLKVLPEEFLGHTTHFQTIIKPPLNSKLLAKNDFEGHHAIVIGNKIWGVQFHPEFDKNIMLEYIKADEKHLIESGYDIQKINESVIEHDYGRMLLKRFTEICNRINF
ncbi:GMP synthase (glutamine-hydrolysing) [Caloramator quimbayensis]|uniref:GMP synthase (Glutamine-hydrolysing) n=1 Tax=Caloramator quimbayensis TaxID=1147123 RepID=A0A1T4YCU9_9CLOT|nr:glutamine amidotransferase [Caloramator quimbayensis]SKA99657.1 GMP synthase (glutamine-hydrolysing) [Caloramator quimbayensis]